jgi:hypothetical protein
MLSLKKVSRGCYRLNGPPGSKSWDESEDSQKDEASPESKIAANHAPVSITAFIHAALRGRRQANRRFRVALAVKAGRV